MWPLVLMYFLQQPISMNKPEINTFKSSHIYFTTMGVNRSKLPVPSLTGRPTTNLADGDLILSAPPYLLHKDFPFSDSRYKAASFITFEAVSKLARNNVDSWYFCPNLDMGVYRPF